jgi:hypothetical protein
MTESPELTLSGALAEQALLEDGKARFRLLLPPEGNDGQELTPQQHDVREAVLPCSLADPFSAAELAALPAGAPLKVTGYLELPAQPASLLRLVVLTVEPDDPDHEAFAAPAPPPSQRPPLRLVRAGEPTQH